MLRRCLQNSNKVQRRSYGRSKNGTKSSDTPNTNNGERKHKIITGIRLAGQTRDWAARDKGTNIIRKIEVNERGEKIIKDYENVFKNNQSTEDLTIYIQLKKDAKPIQQKWRPVPIHLQNTVRNELERLIEKGHVEETDETTENFFMSPAVITIKKDRSVKIALDSRKLNESCKKKTTMPNMEKLISLISAKITKNEGELWISKIKLI